MANARALDDVPSPAKPDVVVDPAIARVIASAGRPVGVPPPSALPPEIPGVTGRLAGVQRTIGLLRGGITFSIERGLERFGEIYTVPIGGVPAVLIWNADEIHKIGLNEDQAWSTAMGWDVTVFSGLDARTGNVGSLLSLDFADHRAARKLVQPAFTLNAIKGYLAIAEASFELAIRGWIAAGRVDFKAAIRTLLANVAGEIFTGVKDPARIRVIDRALSDFWNGVFALSRSTLLSRKFRRARRGFETLRSTFVALAPERRERGGDDLFSHMCSVEDRDGQGDEALVRVFLTIMFGAFDTTSAGMTSMAYLLAKHPAWQERLRDEVRSAAGDRLDVSNMKGLKQLEWAWKETLRLMPISAFLPRRALRDVVVAGHRLPAGTMVAPMAGAIGRHPKWWKEPNKFDPERFSPERAEDKQHPGIYNPFGLGAHACVGMQLANVEMKAFWYRMLRECRFSLDPDYEGHHTNTPLGCVSGDVRLRLDRLGS